MKNNIVIFGAQGSGKGTQADILCQKFKIPHISVGEIIRDNIKAKNDLSKKIASIINQGNLIPDKMSGAIVEKRLAKKDCEKGYILEGYPRNLNQLKNLDKINNLTLVLEIWISDKEAIKRIGGRRSCPKCGDIYHLKFNPPKVKGICNKCGEKLVIRDDDKEEAIKQRLKIYHENTEPLFKHYKKRGIFKKINGLPPIRVVTKEIMKIFK
ncbi:MAG: nucleoside monophosphate kinase [Patescibacteria group bacterium]